MWIKSSRCHVGGCVEATRDGDEILVRDSKTPDGPILHFTPAEWDAFLDGIKHGEFDTMVLQGLVAGEGDEES